MLDHDAAVHDDVDASGFGSCCSFLVDDSHLHPDVWEFELDHLVDDGRDEPRQTEDVDDVRLDGKIGEAGTGFFAEDLRDGGVDWVDLVSVLLHVLGDEWLGLEETSERPMTPMVRGFSLAGEPSMERMSSGSFIFFRGVLSTSLGVPAAK